VGFRIARVSASISKRNYNLRDPFMARYVPGSARRQTSRLGSSAGLLVSLNGCAAPADRSRRAFSTSLSSEKSLTLQPLSGSGR
jgi:hypothetical protein